MRSSSQAFPDKTVTFLHPVIIIFRVGHFYPELSADFNQASCPEYWQSHKKIKINLMNANDRSIAAYIAIGLDLLVGIAAFTLVWRYSGMPNVYRNSKDELFGLKLFRGFGKMIFIITKIIIGFGFISLLDTIMGKGIYLQIYISELYSKK